MAKGEKTADIKPVKTEKDALKLALKALGHKDADLTMIDDNRLDRHEICDLIIAQQRLAKKAK